MLMPLQDSGIDLIAYDGEGRLVLLGEVKSRRGTSEGWAARFRKNMLADRTLPWAKYFLIATPERMYLWKQENPTVEEAPPTVTIDATKALEPYFAKLRQKPSDIAPQAFQFLVVNWLTDIARLGEHKVREDPSLRWLSDSGLVAALQQAHIEMNPT